MAFSSRRRNYLLTPHRKDGLIDWMKSMLNHSFVLDALDTTAADTFSHFEMLIEEHRQHESLLMNGVNGGSPTMSGMGSSSTSVGVATGVPSRLKQLVPTVGTFHTHLPLRRAFVAYNKKYGLTKRKFITISFNELRHILNLAQIMALRVNANDDEYDDDEGQGQGEYFGAGSGGEEGIIAINAEGKLGTGKQQREDASLRESLKSWENSPGYLKAASSFLPDPNASLLPPMSLGTAAAATATAPTPSEKKSFLTPTIHDHDGGYGYTSHSTFKGPKMITFDGDQTLYSDGANFEGNPELANYLYLLLRQGVTLAVVTAAGYEYQREKYETRLSGLLAFFKTKNLPAEDCERFYLFGGECNFLLRMGPDYRLHPIKEYGAGGWKTATKYIEEAPGNWNENKVQSLLDVAQECVEQSISELKIRGMCLRKKRAVGLIAKHKVIAIPREALDEVVLRVQEKLDRHSSITLPFCAFNGGSDVWVDVGNKRVGVHILASYLGMPPEQTIHVGDQFLNTGNDFAARDICPCIWITNPDETTYILKSILRLAGVPLESADDAETTASVTNSTMLRKESEDTDVGVELEDGKNDEHGGGVTSEEKKGGAGGQTTTTSVNDEKKINFSTMIQRHSLTMLDKMAHGTS